VKKGGVPLRKARILLADLTHPEVQTTYALTTDDDGAVPSEFLQTGRRYGVLYQPPVVQADASNRGFLTWDARREIDIGELERVP
jgi:hypothetical protein